MRKSIKTVCSVFCLIAFLGSMQFSSATSFKDEGSIKYKTAVGVMNGMGIINGYSDGAFKPNEYITREQAAKMITYAIIGEQGVIELPHTETGFFDVSSDRWSAPYINWCKQNDIIAGYGDGRFDPTGSVTGYQFSKMLLCAAGYGKNSEYLGSSWRLQASKDGFAQGIFTGINKTDLEMNATREEAALYIFNAITRIEKVVYDSENSKYVPADGTELLDNTLASSSYGIVTTGENATVYNGVITENSSNSEKPTVIDGKELNYITGLNLLGHNVTMYTNGQENLKQIIYYLADESTTVELKQSINDKDSFEKTFGNEFYPPAEVMVFTGIGVLGDDKTIPCFDSSEYTAPAGSYIFCNNTLISYVPYIDEFAAVIGEETDGNIKIGEKEYPVESVFSPSGEYASGDIVLAKLVENKINIIPATSFEGYISRIDTDFRGQTAYTISDAVIMESCIRNETNFPETSVLELSKLYTFYLDSQGDVFAIVPAQ